MEKSPNKEDRPMPIPRRCKELEPRDIKMESNNVNCVPCHIWTTTDFQAIPQIGVDLHVKPLSEETCTDNIILPDEFENMTCPTCKESFCNLVSLNKHVMENHYHSCKMCGGLFQNELLLGEHLAIVHNIHDPKLLGRLITFWRKRRDNCSRGTTYSCPVCESEDFSSLAQFEKHVTQCHLEENARERSNVAVSSLGAERLPEVPVEREDHSVCWGTKDTTKVHNLDHFQPADETQTLSINPLKTYSGHKRKRKLKIEHDAEFVKGKNVGDVHEEKSTVKRAGRQKALPRKAEYCEKVKFEPSDALGDIQRVSQKTEKSLTVQRCKGINNDPFMRCFLKEVDTNQESGEKSEDRSSPDPEQPLQENHTQGRDTGLAGCLNNANLLYLLPVVEYRTAYAQETSLKEGTDGAKLAEGYLEPVDKAQSQKIELFYHQPILRETSSSNGNHDLGCTDVLQSDDSIYPTPKVFILSAVDSIESVRDANLVLEGALADGRDISERSFDDCDRCVLCKEVFPDKTKLQHHMVSVHIDERDNRCGICDRTFDDVIKARSHVIMEHIDVQCKCCQREFKKSTSLRKHMMKHGVGKLQSTAKRCEVCLKSFRSATALADHVVSVHPSLLEHQCDLCEKTFLTEDELFIHVDMDPHLCLLCSMYFENTLTLREHLLGHASDLQVLQMFTAPEVSGS